MSDKLTSNLRLELEKTNNQFQHWIQQAFDSYKETHSSYLRDVEESQYKIQGLQNTNIELEQSRQTYELIKEKQASEVNNIKNSQHHLRGILSYLESEYNAKENYNNKLQSELTKIKSYYNEKKQDINNKLNELINSLKFFKKLGLVFSTELYNHNNTLYNSLKINFHYIKENDPLESYSVLLIVENNTDTSYQILNSEPQLSREDITILVDDLNATNNLSKFICNLRKIFCNIALNEA